jgi:LPS sulfotransferase NodH
LTDTRPGTSYLILSTPRSGSNLLCRGLEDTNFAGIPREHFSPESKYWAQYGQGADPRDYVARLVAERSSPNGVFGAKVSWRQMVHFGRACRAVPRYRKQPLHAIIADLLPGVRYLRITRRDKLRQAISYWKAHQTGVWGRAAGQEQAPAAPPAFDFDGISKVRHMLVDHEAGIEQYVARAGDAPFTVVYEELVDAYEETLRAALRYLDIALPPDLVIEAPRMVRQADAESEAWVDRYLQLADERGQNVALVSSPAP